MKKNTTKRKDGRMQRSFTVCGKRYYVYGTTKQELDQKEHEKRTDLESKLDRRTNPTLDQYHEKWEEARQDVVKISTLRCQSFQYQACANVRIESAGKRLGDIKLREITVDDIRETQRALQDGRTTQTVNDALAVLSHIFNDAILERRLDFNPCKPVKNLKRKEPKARDTVHRALTVEETEIFFKEAEKSFYYDVFRIAINTGMRCGEIGALYSSDIYDDMIHIERTITKTASGGYEIGDTAKTDHGRRQIPLNDTIREIIDHQRSINNMLDGNIISMHERIFKAPERGLLMATPADREISRICKRTGIQKFTMHAFRDTFATRMIESGANPKTLQEILGHANFNLTMSLYGHVMDDSKRKAMDNLRIFG